MDKIKEMLDEIKNNKKVLIVGGVVLVVLVVLILVFVFFGKLGSDTKRFIDEYESLNVEKTIDDRIYPEVNISNDSKVEYLTIKETLEILKNGTATIYVGYPECLYCRSAVQVLFDTAKDSDIDRIYYLDISKVWDIKEIGKDGKVITTKKANKNYSKFLKELDGVQLEDYIIIDKDGKEVNTKEKRVPAPLVLFVVDGDIVSFNVGTLFSQEDPYVPLNQEQFDGLGGIYSYGFRDVLNGMKKNNK